MSDVGNEVFNQIVETLAQKEEYARDLTSSDWEESWDESWEDSGC